MHITTDNNSSPLPTVMAHIGAATVAIASAAGVWWAGTASWAALQSGPPTFDDLVAFGSACTAAALVSWLAIATVASGLAHLPGTAGRLARAATTRLVPIVVRHALPTLFGATALAVPAATLAHGATPASATQPAAACAVEPVGRPAAAADSLRPATPPTHDPRLPDLPRRSEHVVVGPGDSLWSLAAEHLGQDATNADIATEWPRWFAANRDEIGPDPNVLPVGAVLNAPDRP